MAGDMAGAKVAIAQVVHLDPNWSVEKYLSDSGGYPDDAATLFVDAARKTGHRSEVQSHFRNQQQKKQTCSMRSRMSAFGGKADSD
jgi:hypothetical protein